MGQPSARFGVRNFRYCPDINEVSIAAFANAPRANRIYRSGKIGTHCKFEARLLMRAGPLAALCTALSASIAIAGSPMAPNDIQATFFNGQPFTATALTGAKFKMAFTPDRKMTRESLGQSSKKSTGTWKLNAKGFCTSWEHAKSNCFTVVPTGENKWSVQKIATTISVSVAVWSK
jgi:hypothetical protein